MAQRDRPDLFVTRRAEPEPYRWPGGGGGDEELPSPANRQSHAGALRKAWETTQAQALARREASAIDIAGTVPGIYVTFESFPGIELAFESFDPQHRGLQPQLRSVAIREVAGQKVEYATVFVPDGKLGYFLSKIDAYEQSAGDASPRNRKMLDRVETVGIASLRSLWTDPPNEFPGADQDVWWQVWLRRRDGEEAARFRAFAEHGEIEVAERTLGFTDRLVMLVRAMGSQLATALNVLDDLAELRKPRTSAEFVAMEPASDQADWVDDVVARMTPAGVSAPAACIVDTGVDQGHALLEPSLDPADCHACDPRWSTDDHDGHGTEMAGLALFGDLGAVVAGPEPVRLRHRLESVKLLPPKGQNPPELWGSDHRDGGQPGRDSGAPAEAGIQRLDHQRRRPSRRQPSDQRRPALVVVGGGRRPRGGSHHRDQ